MNAIAKPDELPRNVALMAHEGTSFVPGERASQEQQGYADHVNAVYAELLPLAVTDEQRTLLASEIARYKAGYLQHLRDYLGSRGRCMSTMIAGPSNFPVRRMEKYNRWAQNKLTALLEFDKRAQAAMRRALVNARTEEQKDDFEWRALKSDILGSLATIHGLDTEGGPWTRALFVSSIVGKVERSAARGEVGIVEKALALVKEYNDQNKKPAISARHKFWTFADVARAAVAKHDAKQNQEESTVASGDGWKIVSNPSEDRVQIFFPGKPAYETRERLKGEGWRWSPNAGAWQRKLTGNAIESAKRLMASEVVA